MNNIRPSVRTSYLIDTAAGLLGAASVVFTGLALSVLPALDTAHAVRQFYNDWSTWLLVILTAIAAFFFGQLWSLGWLTSLMGRNDPGASHSWIAFGAELMFMTVFSVQIGVLATAHLIADRISDQALYTLHTLGMVLAAPIAFAGAAYFAALVVFQRRTRLFPAYVSAITSIGVVGNLSAIGGLFTLTGPWNAGNGLLTIGIPFATWFLWYAALPGWYARYGSAAVTRAVTDQATNPPQAQPLTAQH